ncbi:MAG: 6-phospho-beta-glucosidase [Anaerolineae bacterium]|jgi:6-phospho-beta-glucosidase
MLKITVVGGGSTYTPELISGFLQRVDSLPVHELCLVDPSPDRLRIVGGFAQRMVAAQGNPFQIVLTPDPREGLRDANYVIVQLRVGGMAARREDEYLGYRHGLIGQETTGVGGMANALRTIPVVLQIAEDMQRLAPGALLVNFSNPAGLVVEALSRIAPHVDSVGLCNVPITVKMELLEIWGEPCDPLTVHLDTLGLNHLSWHRGLTVAGQDVWPQILARVLDRLRSEPQPEWQPVLIETLGAIPNYYLHYYYHTAQKLAAQREWPPSRAEEVMAIETQLLDQYAGTERADPPPGLMERGGAYYSTAAAQLIEAHYHDLGQIHVLNVPHRGAVPGWPEDWVLEMPCRVSRAGIESLPVEPLPPACSGLVTQVKAYELLTVEAAVHGDRRAAYQALLAHPLGPAGGRIQAVLDDMLQTNRPLLPAFWA